MPFYLVHHTSMPDIHINCTASCMEMAYYYTGLLILAEGCQNLEVLLYMYVEMALVSSNGLTD